MIEDPEQRLWNISGHREYRDYIYDYSNKDTPHKDSYKPVFDDRENTIRQAPQLEYPADSLGAQGLEFIASGNPQYRLRVWPTGKKPPAAFDAEYRALHAFFELGLVQYENDVRLGDIWMEFNRPMVDDEHFPATGGDVSNRPRVPPEVFDQVMTKIMSREMQAYFKALGVKESGNGDAWKKVFMGQKDIPFYYLTEMLRYMGQPETDMVHTLEKALASYKHGETHWALLETTERHIPLLWFCFSLTHINAPALVLHAWSKSLMGMTMMYPLRTPRMGDFALSLLLHAASKLPRESKPHLRGQPIPIVFLDIMEATGNVVEYFNAEHEEDKIRIYYTPTAQKWQLASNLEPNMLFLSSAFLRVYQKPIGGLK